MPIENEKSHLPMCVYRSGLNYWVCTPACIHSPVYPVWKKQQQRQIEQDKKDKEPKS